MRIYLYDTSCEGCFGNHALDKMKQVCKQQEVEFQERRTIFWDRWEKEAEEIKEANPGLELPFFYCVETGEVKIGNSLTPLEDLENWVKKQKQDLV